MHPHVFTYSSLQKSRVKLPDNTSTQIFCLLKPIVNAQNLYNISRFNSIYLQLPKKHSLGFLHTCLSFYVISRNFNLTFTVKLLLNIICNTANAYCINFFPSFPMHVWSSYLLNLGKTLRIEILYLGQQLFEVAVISKDS